MIAAVRGYFDRLVHGIGNGWNRFWYTPADPLPLGVIRAATGLAALYVHLTLTPDVARFFQAGGLLPVGLAERLSGGADAVINTARLSYLSYLSTPTELYVAHALGAVVLLLFTVGFYSRVTAVLALLVTLATVHRAPMMVSEVEPLLAMLQFYLCLGPCGAAFSVDRWLARRRATGPQAQAVARSTGAAVVLRLMQTHLCLIYLMMGLAKVAGPGVLTSVEEWYDPWGGGEAVWWLVARPLSPWLNLTWLHNWTYTINAWTHLIVLLELSFPVLIWNRLTRPLLLTVAALMWTAFALISGVAVLSVLMIVAGLAFFPAEVFPAVLRVHSNRTGEPGASALG